MWQKLGLIFKLNQHMQPWMKSHALMPTPLLLKDRIRVYFTVRHADGASRICFADVDRADPTNILHVHDKPLLEPGAIGTFDDSGTVGTFALEHEGKIYLYYNGYNVRVKVPWSNAIGLAVSEDGGTTFRKAFEGPVIDRNHLEPYFAITPWILKENGQFRCWYTSATGWVPVEGKAPEPLYVIKYAQSADGVTWARENRTCIHPLDAEEANARGSVIKHGGLYKMWFIFRGSRDFRDGTDAYRMGYAESADGLTWTRDDARAGIPPGAEGEWDARMQAYPAVIEADGRLLMFYNGNGFGAEGFGCAVRQG